MQPHVKIEKLVHGGQGLGQLVDGRKVFVWNTLPGELVRIRLIKNKKDYAEAVAEEIIEPSPERLVPREKNYLATSPWQIINLESENKYKKAIIEEIFSREHLPLPDFEFLSEGAEWNYRNKMEYSFWGDDDGLHLALHRRGSKGKQIVTGSELALPSIDKAAAAVLHELSRHNVRAGDLKTLIVRCNQGETVASLFVKPQTFVKLELPENIKGMRVYHSNPKSPASVATRLLQEIGSVEISDELLGQRLTYDVDSFFQVNIPVFKRVLEKIKQNVGAQPVVDMYGGVGSIGLSVSKDPIIVELDNATVAMAKVNAQGSNAIVVHASSEKALEYISKDRVLIIDPPRAGLHKDVVGKILDVKPSTIMYLSCNPATQARDIALLQKTYKIAHFNGYNFFPKTPHIETLAILQRR